MKRLPEPPILRPIAYDVRIDFPHLDADAYWFIDRSGEWNGPHATEEDLWRAIARASA